MKKYKKAEGTASSYLIALLIGITAIIMIGTTISNLTNKYSVSTPTEFSGFNSSSDDGVRLIADDFQTSVSDNSTGNGGYATSEDLSFGKVIKIMWKLPGTGIIAGNSLVRGLELIGIPKEITVIIAIILSIVMIALIIKIVRGFDHV